MIDTDNIAVAPDEREDYEIYEDVALADMEWLEDEQLYVYDCPCGDIFAATKEELKGGKVILMCPTCSLAIKVIEIDEKLLA